MASYSFSCRDAGLNTCGARVQGESQQEVVNKAVEHARRAHGVDLTQARSLMRLVEQSVQGPGGGGWGR